MKTITRSNIYLPMAAMILTAVLAVPAAAQQQVPFKGTFQGKDAVNPATIATSGTGIGTLMGAFSLTQETSLTTLTGPAHWVAANGDSIDSTFVASPDFSTHPLGYITVTEIHTITRQKSEFGLHFGGIGHSIGDFLAKEVAISLPEPMNGYLERSF
jgi:hypothetical protein